MNHKTAFIMKSDGTRIPVDDVQVSIPTLADKLPEFSKEKTHSAQVFLQTKDSLTLRKWCYDVFIKPAYDQWIVDCFYRYECRHMWE